MTETLKNLLWIDDHIERYGLYVDELRKTGFAVDTASSAHEAIRKAKEKKYDVILVDISMPQINGIEAIRRLHPIQSKAVFAVFSSFLYLDRFLEELRGLDFEVEMIEKVFPIIGSEDFYVRFINPIKGLAEKGVHYTIKNHDDNLENILDNVDPFSIDLSTYLGKPPKEKEKLIKLAESQSSGIIQKCFSEGMIWILLCGSKNEIRASASRPEEILTEDEIMQLARILQRAPYQFFRPSEIDEGWTIYSAPGKDFYPTVTIIIGNTEYVVHFDTGSQTTFFSYEELIRIEEIRPTSNFGISYTKGQTYFATQFRFNTILRCQCTGRSKKIVLCGQAVRDWMSSPFAVFAQNSKERHLIPGRVGLIGRNLLNENQIKLLLDGENSRTWLID